MHPSKGLKVGAKIFGTGTGVTAAATVTATIDRWGFDDIRLTLVMGTADVVSNKPTTLKVEEGDTTDSTAFTVNTVAPMTGGSVGNTSGFFVIPTAITTGTNIYVIDVDCRGRKRYLRLTVAPATTQEAVLVWELFRAKETPNTVILDGSAVHVNA